VSRLHAERGDAVKRAKASRITWGFDSRNFQDDWKYVEVLTGQIAEAERELEEAGAEDRKLKQVYLRWHLDLDDGGSIESNGLPYFAKVSGAKVSLVAADLVYLENERKALTANGRKGSMHLRMMELRDNGSGYHTVNLVQELEAGENTQTKHAAEAAMDLIALISRMPDEEAGKVVNVITAGMKVLIVGQAMRKAHETPNAELRTPNAEGGKEVAHA